jgi:hypothetical protein
MKMVRKSVYEILVEVSEVVSFHERVKVLRSYNNIEPLKAVLKYAFDPKIKFLLPEGAPPYKENDFPDQQGNLYYNYKKLYLFVEGGNPNITDLKREDLFIGILETVDKDDAKVLVGMKDKTIHIKNITEKLAERAFPEIFK